MISRIPSHIIAYLCYRIDRTCRQELHDGQIVSERDYVSNLGTHLRFPFGPFINVRLAIAQTLPPAQETRFGCDSIIIFKKGQSVKIGIFEAKWTRYFTNFGFNWDSHRTNGESRFSSQVRRQRAWVNSGLAIWQMFLNETAPGSVNGPFDNFGSSCVLHQDAHNYLVNYKQPTNTLWYNSDMNGLLTNSVSFGQLVFNILRCSYGKLFSIENYQVSVIDVNNETVEVPIARADERNSYPIILSFMEKNGLINYIHIDIIDFEGESR